ncbi:hypothetical protein Z946_3206 [Sulfitobacter noctilucicola]|nr:hypothetical protein Z946_3206 [Sulfitobacter noctilucicola]
MNRMRRQTSPCGKQATPNAKSRANCAALHSVKEKDLT